MRESKFSIRQITFTSRQGLRPALTTRSFRHRSVGIDRHQPSMCTYHVVVRERRLLRPLRFADLEVTGLRRGNRLEQFAIRFEIE